ncbi:MAG: acetyl-CoA decarbonylase/synthase complex subunit delta [Treponema sp.]|jgi:acetyl-CoA decarbonylase/synthase complex subunit delta|nr:acetyl-CoA decarbonylase/synthase complex subunit delta [Treponema sp.]
MGYKHTAQVFSAAINKVTIGTGSTAITLGGENVFPLYSFDGAIANPPRVGIEFSDNGPDRSMPALASFYQGAESIAEITRRACEKSGADFVSLILSGADPNGENKSIDECVALCVQAAEAAALPLVIQGCKNAGKDAVLFEKIAAALHEKNVLLLSAREENYKTVAVAAVQAYGHKAGAESSVDINLAKQLNVLISQLGVQGGNIVMNPGSAAAGYGFEYIASTMDRIKAAALDQNDTMLQIPIITPVGEEAWSVKEAVVSEEDFPNWGPVEQRGIDMEITTAAACLASGSNAVILRHPASVSVVKKLIADLV